MNLQLALFISAILYFDQVTCNCGCLKCSSHLKVVSPPHLPYKVIYRGNLNSCGQPLPYTVQAPVPPPPPLAPIKNYDYQVRTIPSSSVIETCEPLYAYKYQVQAPVIVPPISLPVTGLIARPDRIVIPAPNDCPVYTGCGEEVSQNKPLCRPLWPDTPYRPLPQIQIVETPRSGPILEKLPSDLYHKVACECRYGSRKKRRAKRELPLLKSSVNFIMGLLPNFIRFPIQHTLRSFVRGQKIINREPYYARKSKLLYKLVPKHEEKARKSKPSTTSFLEKLQKLNSVEDNGRKKRALMIEDNDEIHLPFLRVTDIENAIASSEEEEESSEESLEERRKDNRKEEFLRPLNFDHMLPHNPIFYFLNAPIRFLHHFHKFGQQLFPVFRSVPHVFVNSKRYLRQFGKHLKNDVLNIASDLIGDFDEFGTNRYRYLRPRRYRRSLNRTEPYEPEYSLVFDNQNEEKKRRKRYILKVVDEDEVEEFLREKLGGLTGDESWKKNKERENKNREETRKRNRERENANKKKLVVEKLSSKLIIDNKGRPFVEINGQKRPLFPYRRHQQEEEEKKEDKPPPEEDKLQEKEEVKKVEEEKEEDMKEKINSLIMKARERIDQHENPVIHQNEVPVHIIKDRINQILTEIQDLINLDFDKYSKIHNDLCKLQSFKDVLVNDWKKILIENKHNDMTCKIRILDDFKEMQILKDKAVQDIASVLANGSNFMTKKLIKMLVRLQKLQCIIYRVVEDFGERIKMGTQFDVKKEIKYIDYLSELSFVVGRNKHDLEQDLKSERDKALENEIFLMENLRKLLENNNRHDPHKLYEEAKLLWEIRNVDKLQKDTVSEMNEKISRGQKVRKELKILFDLLKQLESSEEKQKKLLEELSSSKSHHRHSNNNVIYKETSKRRSNRYENPRQDSNLFPHKTIIEDKKPIRS